jgi:hypothetical protein
MSAQAWSSSSPHYHPSSHRVAIREDNVIFIYMSIYIDPSDDEIIRKYVQ